MKEQPITIFRREALLLRRDTLNKKQRNELKDLFTYRFYEDRACAQCEYRQDRHCDICDNCEAFKGVTQLAKQVRIQGTSYLSYPIGGQPELLQKLRRFGKKHRLVIKHPKHQKIKKKHRIKFTGTLRDPQKKSLKDIMKYKRGVLKAPPRSGKCIVGSSLVMGPHGLVPISSMFDDYKLKPNKATVIDVNYEVATLKGTKPVDYLYSKVVDTTYKLSTKRGYNIEGTPEHPVRIMRSDLKPRWVKMRDIKEGDYIVGSLGTPWTGRGDSLLEYKEAERAKNDSVEPLQKPAKLSSYLARILGYLVANGSLSIEGRMHLSSNNHDVLNDYVYCIHKVFPNLDPIIRKGQDGRVDYVSLDSKQAMDFLRGACGLVTGRAAAMEVPSIILTRDRKYLLEFLAAYLSCDSSLCRKGMELSSASLKLMHQLQVILTHLGITSTLKEVQAKAANSKTATLRSYGRMWVHATGVNQLLTEITLLKDVPEMHDGVNQNDYVPFVPEFLRSIQARHQANTSSWLINGERISKAKAGTLLQGNRKGTYRKGYNFYHSREQYINYDTIEMLEPKAATKLRKAFNPALFYDRVTSVERIDKPQRVYDLSVPKVRHFIANGIAVHNTVVGTAFSIKTKNRTLILASQRDWLMGFYETFCGSETQKALTTARGVGTTPAEIRANLATGKRFDVGFVRTKEDADRYNYGLATVQTFYRNPKLLKYILSKYNTIIVDEIHTGAAKEFARVLSALNSEYYLGLSGTPNRKDQRYVIVEKTLGPIIHEMHTPRLRPTVKLTPTTYVNNSKNPMWANFVTNIENNKPRLNLIAERVVSDIKAGHMVLIVMARIKAITTLVQLINAKMGEDVALAFTGSTKDRDKVLNAARNYEIKVLVGQQKIMTTGVNIPRASALYEVTPSSNIENCEQRVSRILTPYEGKPDPILRIFLDDTSIRRNCLRNEWTKCMVPIMKAKISTTELKILETYLAAGTSSRRNWDF